ncbi:DJ-1/PfpI family protein [Sphingopyxis sp. KK2]|uniref:DJ-1/PfpI family protein n=1 Tax=Sphingopyxis sp. KK2 TaxID=1855727 RepID=UPI00097E5BA8|nr:DJ-1/PfpI family protein [Sphingopyxis sp. KK2]
MRIVIPVYPEVDLLDVCGPAEMFNWAKFDVALVAADPGPITFNNGFQFNVTAGLDSVTPCDALWVPGGEPDALQAIMFGSDRRYQQFVTAQAAQARYICSVCEGALLVAHCGLLDGYNATTHWAFIPYLLQNYPAISVAPGHPRFVLDRNRLTGGGISSGLDEALQLISLLGGEDLAASVQQTTQYYPHPPVDSDIPNIIQSPMPPVPA